MAAPRIPFCESSLATRLALLVSVGTALLFRLPGIHWGLPLKYAHIDESVVIHYALRIVSGALNPNFYDYPGFFLFLLAGLIRLVALVHGWVWGAGLEGLVKGYLEGDPTVFTLTARGLTVSFALLTVAFTFYLGRRRKSTMVGLGAALLLGVNALHIRSSHYGTLDVAACFFTFWSLAKIGQFGLTRHWRDGGEAAFLVGLATATKYYPGVLIVPLFLLPFVGKHPRPEKTFVFLAGLSFAGLFLGSPFTVLSAGEFLARFNHLAPKIVGLPGDTFPLVSTISNLWQGAGPLAFLAGAAGIALAFREKGFWRILAVLWLTLFVFLGCWKHQPPHYGLALYPPLFLFAVYAGDKVPWRRPWPAVVLTSVLFAFALPRAVGEIRYLRMPETRLQAARWVRENIPPGSRVLRFSHTPDFKKSDPFLITVDFTDERLKWVGQNVEEQKKGIDGLKQFEFLILSGELEGGTPASEMFHQSFHLLKKFSEPPANGYHNPVVSVYAVTPTPP